MPTFRFKKMIKTIRDTRVFFGVEVGASRGPAPKDGLKDQNDRQLKAARGQIRKQRRTLANKEQEITRLKMALSAAGKSPEEVLKARPASRVTVEPDAGALPDFVIIGAQKCGTTFLYHLLNQHPLVAPAVVKEVNYFDVNFDKGVDWYRAHFPSPEQKDGRKVITGEASPYYLYHPHAAKRAAKVVPQAKLIALLRNPVDRAYSDHQQRKREGREELQFKEAMAMEEARLLGEREKMLADESYNSPKYRNYSYLSRGVYVDQLQEWHKYFDRDQLLVLKSEDLYGHTQETFERVLEFLGLPWEPELGNLLGNRDARHEGGYEPLGPDTRQQLEEYFEPHNRRLYEHLGVDFGW